MTTFFFIPTTWGGLWVALKNNLQMIIIKLRYGNDAYTFTVMPACVLADQDHRGDKPCLPGSKAGLLLPGD